MGDGLAVQDTPQRAERNTGSVAGRVYHRVVASGASQRRDALKAERREALKAVWDPDNRMNPGKVVDPRPLGPEQDRGPAVDTGGEREVPDHRHAIGRVLDRARCNRRHETGP